MFRRLAASLAAAALMLATVLPTPAAAMSDKDRQLLTVLLGAAVVGAIIHDANKDKRKPAPVTRRHDQFRYDNWNDRDWRGQGWQGDRWGQRAIPAECVISIRGAGGRREVVSARCLKEAGLRRDLPAECAFDIDAGWGSRKVYGTRCLRQNGFRIAGNR
ncbi:hypothetical protein [Albidovulum sp.]|jgi:hypothetical protein|uniref:hypothetical protein n=1 Tax=Albidovulum sp. TaxID=1872424 RepID=UPI0030467D1E